MDAKTLCAKKERIQRQIEHLEKSLGSAAIDPGISSSETDDSDLESDNSSDEAVVQSKLNVEDLSAKKVKIQREIEELERTLGPAASSVDANVIDSDSEDEESDKDVDIDGCLQIDMGDDAENDDDLGLPKDSETCLQINLVYQEVIEEKLLELERMVAENKELQNEILSQLSKPTAIVAESSSLPPLRLFVGNFLKPYFKDKITGVGPPANSETKEKMAQGIKSFEDLRLRRWKTWQKNLLRSAVAGDRMRQLLQPKLSKLDFLTQKLTNLNVDVEKQIVEKQIRQTEQEIVEISCLSEELLYGERLDEHDWDKISNIDFEGVRNPEELKSFWQNYEHPSVNKEKWNEEEIEKLKEIAAKHRSTDWEAIASELGTNRTAFMCLEKYQAHINTNLKRKYWTKEEDKMLLELVEKMKVGNHIPYTKISYFMEGREAAQVLHRYKNSIDPSLKRGYWSSEEDALLLKAVAKYGAQDWYKIRLEVPGRNVSQCRDRYMECLSNEVKKGKWSPEEEIKLIELTEKYGAGRWSKIAAELQNRTDGQCLRKWCNLTKQKKNKKKLSGRKRHKKEQRKGNEKRKKSSKRAPSREVHSSSSESEQLTEIVSEEVNTESDEEDDDYTVTSIDSWIPVVLTNTRTASNVRSRRTVISKVGANSAQPSQDPKSRAQPVSGTDLSDPVPERNIVVKNNWSGHSRFFDTISSAKAVEESGKKLLKVNLNEVRRMLRPKRAHPRRKKTKSDRRRHSTMMQSHCSQRTTNANQSQAKALTGRIQAMEIDKNVEAGGHKSLAERILLNRFEGNKTVMEKFRKTSLKTSKSDEEVEAGSGSAHYKRDLILNQNLMLAVSPWVGNVYMQCSSGLWPNKRTRADVMREEAEKVGLASTPIFILLLKVFQIDAEGCKNVIEERSKKDKGMLSRRSLPSISKGSINQKDVPPQCKLEPQECEQIKVPTSSRVKTVAQLLYERKKKQSTSEKEAAPNNEESRKQSTEPESSGKNSSDNKDKEKRQKPKEISSHTPPHPPFTLPKPPSSLIISQTEQRSSPAQELRTQPVTASSNQISWIMTDQGVMPFIAVQSPCAVPPRGVINLNVPRPGSGPQVGGPAASRSPANPAARGVRPFAATTVAKFPPFFPLGIFAAPSVQLCAVPGSVPTVVHHLAVNTNTSVTPSTISPTPFTIKDVKQTNNNPSSNEAPPCYNVARPLLPKAQQLTVIPFAQPIIQAVSIPHVIPSHQGTIQLGPRTEQPALQSSSLNSVAPTPKVCPSTSHNTASSKPKRTVLDLSLLFFEEDTATKDWMKGLGGVQQPDLSFALPYLPPSVCNLKTLSQLLEKKSSLESRASGLISDEVQNPRAKIHAIRKVVKETLGHNPAYLLLKARFLSCFTLPAFLATIPPVCTTVDISKPSRRHRRRKNTDFQVVYFKKGSQKDRGQPAPLSMSEDNTCSSLMLNVEGTEASQFKGIMTRSRSRLEKGCSSEIGGNA
ncbi:snRNA-activating protein complex subunit 4 [Erpetoichthys calabaricus]|uniref:snRNA-activating protein complex subunit 4 n=1 Tax=Erpetoichthys calabaricus TaxID=27687 RepID=UPI00223414FD|nr:snRNA-activating protein complex subunit 4 [Erpetoichthys calabaricus]